MPELSVGDQEVIDAAKLVANEVAKAVARLVIKAMAANEGDIPGAIWMFDQIPIDTDLEREYIELCKEALQDMLAEQALSS